jgi:hypothetical protein
MLRDFLMNDFDTKSKSKSQYDRRPVNLGVKPNLGTFVPDIFFFYQSYGLVSMERPL